MKLTYLVPAGEDHADFQFCMVGFILGQYPQRYNGAMARGACVLDDGRQSGGCQ